MRNFLFICLAISISNITYAIDFRCEGPDLHYVHRFNLDATVESLEDGVIFEDQTLEAVVTRAGYEAEPERVSIDGLTLTVKKVEGNFVKVPFYVLTYKKDKKIYANIVLDYPGLMTSFLRTEGLFQYKSTCKKL